MKTFHDYLHDLLRQITAVEKFTLEGKTMFLEDERTQYAVMMGYALIGEVAKRIPTEVLATQPQIDWIDLKGFRDVLIHRYDEIILERVWEAVEDLPNLRAAVEAMLANLPPDEDE